MTMRRRLGSKSVGRGQSSMMAASLNSSDILTSTTASGGSGSYLDLRIIDSNEVVEQTASNPSRSLLPMFNQTDGNSSCDEVFSPAAVTNSKLIVRSTLDSLNITSGSSEGVKSLSVKSTASPDENQCHATLLSGVCAFVEVESSQVSTVANELRRMGATVLLRLTRTVTHFVFSNGRRKMLEKARKTPDLRIVSSLWVHRCFELKRRQHESDYPVTFDVNSDYDDDDVAPSPIVCPSSKPGSKIKTRFMICRSIEAEMALSEKKLNEKKRREEQRKLEKEIAAYDPYTPVRLLGSEDADSSGGSMLGLRPFQSDSDASPLAVNSFVSSNDSVVPDSLELSSRVQALKRQQPSKRGSRFHVEDSLLDTPLAERLKQRLGDYRRASSLVETAPAERRFQKKRPLSPVDVVQSPTPNDSSISMGPVPAENLRRSRRHVAVNTSNDVKESSPSAVKTRRVARRHTIANIRFPQSPTQLLVNRVDQLNIGVAVPATKDPEAVAEKVVEKQAAIPETQLKSPNKQPTTSKARDSSESPLLCEPFEDRAKKGVTMKRRRLGKSEMYRLYAETVETPADADVRRVLNESRRQARASGVYAVKTSSKLLNQLQRGLPSSEEFVDRTRSRIRQRRRSSRKPTSSLVLTSLGTNERNTLLPIIKKLGGYNAAMQVDGSTSHVICKDRRRTLNLLKGVVRGCWIVNDEWVYRSLEMGSWLPEEDFEMADWAPAIKKRRVSADQPSTLFAGVRSFYIAPDCNPSLADLTDLITHSGGKIVPMPRASVFILANRTTLTDRFLRYSGVKAVSEKWVLDSIMMDEIQPFDSYPVL